ncbi:MAG: PHA/PHB synthase family protein [Parvibaculaceae bacterium]
MNDKQPGASDYRLTDPALFLRNITKVMGQAASLAQVLAERPAEQPDPSTQAEPIKQVAKTFGEVASQYINRPDKLMQTQMELWQGHARIWQGAWKRFLGEKVEPVVTTERGDRRFKDRDWEENQVFDFLKQSYLLTARWAHDVVSDAEGIDEHTRHKARFYVEQIANALAPTNFALTNPEVLRRTLSTSGQNLVDGFEQLSRDIVSAKGEFSVRQTDLDAFEVGRNLAVTPGKVVFQNDLLQLIQYEPSTEKVYETPLLIVPPWINKYYILDLTPPKSFVRWAVAQGLTVFVVSWVNPDERLATKTFADYMDEGILAAIGAVQKATGQERINAIGYCIGGTLFAATLAYMAAKGDGRVASITFFASQVDFEKAGDLKVFIDEDQIQDVEQQMAKKGYLEGKRMARAFNLLRSNDLIWSYVVNNYLMGKDPLPFDLLYWNSDSTRMPAATHSFYLRECYQLNNLSRGRMVLNGVPIDLKKVKIPAYNVVTREDHIAPLASGSRLGRFLGGETRLVVAGSGHIAGIVNPPDLGKYQYWTNDKAAEPVEGWLATATEHPGSWWPDWAEWIGKRSGKKIKARKAGSGKLKAIEDAPGSYVKEKS